MSRSNKSGQVHIQQQTDKDKVCTYKITNLICVTNLLMEH